MSIKIGDLDVANEIIELHYQVVRTQLMLEKLIRDNNEIKIPSPEDMREIENQTLTLLQRKFPSMGIKKK